MKRLFFIILPLTVFLKSCGPVYYIPSSATTPLFKEKGEETLTALMGISEFSKVLGLNGGYAITNNIGAIANFNYFDGGSAYERGKISSGFENYNPRRYGVVVEGGLGYFTTLSFDSCFVFDAYIGYGQYTGNVAVNDIQSVSYSIQRPFLQSSIGYRVKSFEVALGYRLASISYANVKPSPIFSEDDGVKEYFYSLNNRRLIEPHLTVRFGSPNVKVQLQMVSVDGSGKNLPVDEVNLSVGLNLRF